METDKEKRTNLLKRMENTGLFPPETIEKFRLDFEIAEQTGSSFITNIDIEDEEFILKAAIKTGFDVYVENDAFSRGGKKLDGCKAVYTKNIYREHGTFWKMFNKLREINQSAEVICTKGLLSGL